MRTSGPWQVTSQLIGVNMQPILPPGTPKLMETYAFSPIRAPRSDVSTVKWMGLLHSRA